MQHHHPYGCKRRHPHGSRADRARSPFGGHRGMGRGFGEGRGHHGRRRQFSNTELQLLLLNALTEQSRHGYELIRAIEARTNGGYAPSPGVVYPALSFMVDAGWITPDTHQDKRRSFTLSEEGRAHLADNADALHEAEARLASLAAQLGQTDAAPVRRAMQNLKTALFNRLKEADAGRDTALAVAAILDEAASKIERVEP